MNFASDNTGPAHPRVLEALVAANMGRAAPYGADAHTEDAIARIRSTFDAPDAAVFLLGTGTAANALGLAALTAPYETVFCSDCAHIHEDECNAPEFYTGGARLTLVPAPDARIAPDALRAALEGEEKRGIHGPARGPVSITQLTELGTAYAPDDLAALSALCKTFGLTLHMDGARFANAVVSTGASPAELSWKSGVDVLSFGGSKNGLLGAEAVIFFNPDHARAFERLRKRGGHLMSKHRYLGAQMAAYLRDDLWLDMARAANRAAGRLAKGLTERAGADLLLPVDGNMLFPTLPAATHRHLFDQGARYHLWGATLDGAAPDMPLPARMVCDWSTTEDEVDRFLDLIPG